MPNDIGKKKLRNTTKVAPNLKAAQFAGDVKRKVEGIPGGMSTDDLLAYLLRDPSVSSVIEKQNPALWASLEKMFPAVVNTQRKKAELLAGGAADINLGDMGFDRFEQSRKLRNVRGSYVSKNPSDIGVPQHESEVPAGDIEGLLAEALAAAKIRR